MTSARHHTSCSAEGCRAQITWGWFCKDHWFAIPADMRRVLQNAFNAARAAHCRAPREEQDRLNRAYGVAFRECQEHLLRAPRTPAHAMTTTAYAQDGRAVTYVEGRLL